MNSNVSLAPGVSRLSQGACTSEPRRRVQGRGWHVPARIVKLRFRGLKWEPAISSESGATLRASFRSQVSPVRAPVSPHPGCAAGSRERPVRRRLRRDRAVVRSTDGRLALHLTGSRSISVDMDEDEWDRDVRCGLKVASIDLQTPAGSLDPPDGQEGNVTSVNRSSSRGRGIQRHLARGTAPSSPGDKALSLASVGSSWNLASVSFVYLCHHLGDG